LLSLVLRAANDVTKSPVSDWHSTIKSYEFSTAAASQIFFIIQVRDATGDATCTKAHTVNYSPNILPKKNFLFTVIK